MIEVLNGQLHQWDTGRKVKIAYEAYPVDEVHFANIGDESALVVETYKEDGEIVANIPNILLQNNRGIYAYLVYRTESGEITQTRHILKVKRRPKPDDYVYTETEVLTWKALDERLKKVEDNTSGVDEEAIANAVEDYMDKHPVNVEETDPTVPAWAKQQEKPKYTAQEVGALSAESLPTAVNEALAQAKASGEFDGADGKPGEPGQPGADGRTPVKGEDYFTEADKQEIAEQAARLVDVPKELPNPNALTFTGAVEGSYDGSKPVSIEIPQGGGGGEWKLFRSFAIPEDITTDTSDINWLATDGGGIVFGFDTDNNGNPFEFSEIFMHAYVQITKESVSAWLPISTPVVEPEKLRMFNYALNKYLSTLAKRSAWTKLERFPDNKGIFTAGANLGNWYCTVQASREFLEIPPVFTALSVLFQDATVGYLAGSSFEFYGR